MTVWYYRNIKVTQCFGVYTEASRLENSLRIFNVIDFLRYGRETVMGFYSTNTIFKSLNATRES